VRRRPGWVALAAITAVLCGCSGTPPWWYQKGTTSCGPPALIRLAGHVKALGDCALEFVVPPPTVTMRVGQELDVHMLVDSNEAPLYPLPHASPASVLVGAGVRADRSTASYRAVHPGRTALITGASCLSAVTKRGTSSPWCPILEVIVIP
jgi:hypothetical protein